jgi:hypothetical protein
MRWDPLISFILFSVLTALTYFFQCCSGLMIYSIQLDESATHVKSYAATTSLCTLSGQLDSLFDRLGN